MAVEQQDARKPWRTSARQTPSQGAKRSEIERHGGAEAHVMLGEPAPDHRRDQNRQRSCASPAARRAISPTRTQSTWVGRCGPCCSVEATGTIRPSLGAEARSVPTLSAATIQSRSWASFSRPRARAGARGRRACALPSAARRSLRGAPARRSALIHEDDVVGDVARKAHLVGDDEHRHPLLGELRASCAAPRRPTRDRAPTSPRRTA